MGMILLGKLKGAKKKLLQTFCNTSTFFCGIKKHKEPDIGGMVLETVCWKRQPLSIKNINLPPD
jgi:hypothetical protein